MEVRYADEVTDPGNHARYSNMAGVHSFSLMFLLDELSGDEWELLASRYKETMRKRNDRGSHE